MVLRLKTRESRSLPGLLKAMKSSQHENKRPLAKTKGSPKATLCRLQKQTRMQGITRRSWPVRPLQETKPSVLLRQSANAFALATRTNFRFVLVAGWSSPVARQAHNLKAAGSNPAPATKHSQKTKNITAVSGNHHAVGKMSFNMFR